MARRKSRLVLKKGRIIERFSKQRNIRRIKGGNTNLFRRNVYKPSIYSTKQKPVKKYKIARGGNIFNFLKSGIKTIGKTVLNKAPAL